MYVFNDSDLRVYRPRSKNEMPNPCWFSPRHISPRISAQSGVFTHHLNAWEEFIPKTLTKLVIQQRFRRRILKELYNCGIDPHFIFQDFDGLAETLSHQVNVLDTEVDSSWGALCKLPSKS